MQTNCPQCSQGIVIDDAKIPERPFSVRCPRCKNTVRFPGKGGPAASVTEAAPSPTPVPAPQESDAEPETMPPAPLAYSPPPAAAPAAVPEEVRAQMMAQLRREISPGDSAGGGAGRALVFLPDRAQAGTVTLTLTRQGFAVDTLEDGDEAARLLEQGVYALLATVRSVNPPGKAPTFYQKLSRLSPEARRRVFVILAGDDFKSGDGTQAFAASADLTVQPRDLGTFDSLLRITLGERQKMYQAYLDARRRFEERA